MRPFRNTSYPHPLSLFLALMLAAAVTGCGNKASDTTSSGGGSGTTTTSVSGSVTKGPVAGASVILYAINADGSRGAMVAGPFATATDGSWSGTIPAGATPPFEVVATGGSYTDEATGNIVNLTTGEELDSLIPTIPASGPVTAAITPFTNALVLSARQMAAGGTAVATAVGNAIASAQTSLGFDPTSVIPPDPLNPPAGASAAQMQYAALLGGISQLGQSAGITGATPIQLALALSQDMADGKLDGLDLSGTQITLSTGAGSSNLPALDAAGMTALNSATTTFTSSQGSSYTGVTATIGSGGFYTPPTTGGGGTTANPTVTSMNPNTGAVGTLVTLTGTDFITASDTRVDIYFGNQLASATDLQSLSATQIQVLVPQGAATAPITIVRRPSGAQVTTKTFTVPSGADTTPPVVTPGFSNLTVSATSPSGIPASDANLAYYLNGATASDNVGVVGGVTNDAPATFPVGSTTVTFSASDAAGNTGTATATVTVTAYVPPDTTPPVVSLPTATLTIAATSASGIAATDTTVAAFLNSATATDNVGVVGGVTNNAPTTFPVGSTTVTFSASDAANNTGTATATVTVTAWTGGGGTTASGDVWTATTLPAGSATFTGLGAAASPSTLVVVGINGGILTSPDGVAWTSRTSGTTVALIRVIWGGNQFVAVGSLGTTLSSPDGITWTPSSTAFNTSGFDNLNGIAWSGTTYVAVGGNTALNQAFVSTSPDGITWSPQLMTVGKNLLDVVWNGSQFVAVGVDAANGAVILTSPDGTTWTSRTSNVTAGDLKAVTWTGTQFVAVGGDRIATSPDGITWTAGTTGNALDDLRDVDWSGTQLVAVGWTLSGGRQVLTSTTGQTWAAPTTPPTASSITLYGVAWTGNQWVATGTKLNGGQAIWTAP